MAVPTLVIAGTHSGVGKTTFTLALMAALKQRGLTVQPFKIGPDFIDAGHHTAVCGRTSRNLDTWMLSESTVLNTFSQAVKGANIAIIEGVMGLFDGHGAEDLRGSTADIARLLTAPIVLVVDAAGASASIAAVVKGFSELNPALNIVGVVCNRVSGPRHYGYLEPAIRRHTRIQPLGWMPRNSEWQIPERHLGLVTAEDFATTNERWEQFGQLLSQTINLDVLLTLASSPPIEAREGLQSWLAPPSVPPKRSVAVARDAAFCFYYPENLELIQAAGGELRPFSPVENTSLPADVDVLYLGGGYPELYAARLAANHSMRQSIRQFHQQGGTIYAECGGLMYVCRELLDSSGHTYPMVDLVPARTIMQPRRVALNYTVFRTTCLTPLGPAGASARGHEFHYSRLEPLEPLQYAAQLERGDGKPALDGIVSGNLIACYTHLHFASNPQMASALMHNYRQNA